MRKHGLLVLYCYITLDKGLFIYLLEYDLCEYSIVSASYQSVYLLDIEDSVGKKNNNNDIKSSTSLDLSKTIMSCLATKLKKSFEAHFMSVHYQS